MSEFYNNSIFWVEVERISPNPYQPRKEFNNDKIAELADSIRQYGVLQPLVVTRKETEREDGGIAVEYELIAGERRLRASKIAGISQVPVIIRAQEESNKMKLELAIIENLQREDLNAIDRATAFKQLVDEFNLKHIEIAKKVGKSREYVSNTLRLLGLPEHIQAAVSGGAISEGHARPLLMLGDDRPQEREVLFNEIKTKKLTVRESERIARRIATDKARKQDLSPELIGLEKELTETLGTRVQIEKRSKNGGKVHIDYFSDEDLKRLLDLLAQEKSNKESAETKVVEQQSITPAPVPITPTALPEVVTAAATTTVTSEAVERFNKTFNMVPPTPAPIPTPAPTQTYAPTPTPNPINPFDMPLPTQTVSTEHQAQHQASDPFADLEQSTQQQAPVEPVVPETPPVPTEPTNPFSIKNFSI